MLAGGQGAGVIKRWITKSSQTRENTTESGMDAGLVTVCPQFRWTLVYLPFSRFLASNMYAKTKL